MTTNAKIKRDSQDISNDSGTVSLFILNLTEIGGSVSYLTPGTSGSSPIMFGGNVYIPSPIKIEGVKYEGNGQMPRPTIEISNLSFALLSEVVSLKDLVGGKVTRLKTYEKYLDGALEADSTAYYPQDTYYLNRKIAQSRVLLKFELKSAVDLENKFIPSRKVFRSCPLIYRSWDSTAVAFNYSVATCPYTDTDYFDKAGVATTAANDVCGHKLFDCRLRFPSTNNTDTQLPGGFFPGIGQFGSPYRN